MGNSSEAALAKLDEAAAQGCELTRNIKASFSGALQVARVANQIRQALTVEMVQELIMPLKECDFGWRTDGKTYNLENIRDVWVSAALVGAVPVNNEVNVISGRMYLCKNYFTRMLKTLPGMTDLVIQPGKVVMLPTGALVEYSATWKLNGNPMQMARTKDAAIPVRLNAGMGADGALGKAERKFKAAIFSMVTGSTFDDSEEDFEELKPAAVTVTERKEPAIPQNALPDPTAAKAGTTQTKATTEKLKKEKTAPVTTAPGAQGTGSNVATPETPVEDLGENEPWAQDPEPADTQPAAEQKVEPPKETKQTAPAAEEMVQVGWEKDNATGEMKKIFKPKSQVKPKAEGKPAAAAKTESAKKAEPEPEKTETPADETQELESVESAPEKQRISIGLIKAIKAHDNAKNPPYRVVSNDADEYFTENRLMATKAKGYMDKKVPVSIDYTADENGKFWIDDVLPEGTDDVQE